MDHRRSAGRAKVDPWRDVDHPGATEDRIPVACPWLITRFIDTAPQFVFVPSEKVFDEAERLGAIPYDSGRSVAPRRALFVRCLLGYGLDEPALQHLAVIVRGADTSRLDLAPQAPACSRSLSGCRPSCADDHEMLGHALRRLRRPLQVVPIATARDPRLANGGARPPEGGMTTTVAAPAADALPAVGAELCRGDENLGKDRPAQLRWPGRADRADASNARRGANVPARRAAVSACPQLLRAAAGARGATAPLWLV